jgi:hypothetical protein
LDCGTRPSASEGRAAEVFLVEVVMNVRAFRSGWASGVAVVLSGCALLGIASDAAAAPAVGAEISLDPGSVEPFFSDRSAVAWDGTNYLVVTVDVLHSTGAYGARVSGSGVLLDSPAMLLDSYSSSNKDAVAVAYGAGTFLVATPSGHVIRVASSGTVVDTPPIALTPSCPNPAAAFDGTNFVVACQYGAGGVAFRVSPAGPVLGSTQFVAGGYTLDQTASTFALAFDGTDYVFLYQALPPTGSRPYRTVVAQWMKTDGTLDGDPWALPQGVDSNRGLACNGAGGCLMVWRDGISVQGLGIRAAAPSTLSTGTWPSQTQVGGPIVQWDGSQYLVLWTVGNEVLGARVKGGTLVNSSDIVSSSVAEGPPALAAGPAGSLLVYPAASRATALRAVSSIPLDPTLAPQGPGRPHPRQGKRTAGGRGLERHGVPGHVG